MPLKSTGNKITKIKSSQKEVTIYFESENIKVSKEAFENMRLYIGQELSKKDIKDILNFSNLTKYISYSLSLFTKRHYTEDKMKEKLIKKGATEEESKKVIRFLKEHDLIDDKAFIEDHLAWCEERYIGKYKILKELSSLGVKDKDIEKVRFSSFSERQKAAKNIPNLEKKYSSLSYENKRRHIYNSLKLLGFDQEATEYALKKISSKDDEDETTKIIKDHDKAVDRLSKKYSGHQLDMKVYSYLKNKGYSHYDIQNVMEVKEYDD